MSGYPIRRTHATAEPCPTLATLRCVGYIAHDTVIVTIAGHAPRVEAFRAGMPDQLRHLLVGPIPSVVNDYVTFVFAPDGSKLGWPERDLADEWRQRFVQMLEESHENDAGLVDVVHVRYGGDHSVEHGPTIVGAEHPGML